MSEQRDVAAGHAGSCEPTSAREEVYMSGLISSVKHVRYALGSLTAVLFSAATGPAL